MAPNSYLSHTLRNEMVELADRAAPENVEKM